MGRHFSTRWARAGALVCGPPVGYTDGAGVTRFAWQRRGAPLGLRRMAVRVRADYVHANLMLSFGLRVYIMKAEGFVDIGGKAAGLYPAKDTVWVWGDPFSPSWSREGRGSGVWVLV